MKLKHVSPWKKGYDKPRKIFKSRDITLPTKFHLVKAMVFPVVMYECESWTIKKTQSQRTDTFELWCWRRLLRVPWTARRSNQSILKEISPEYSLDGLMLKLKLQYFGHLMGWADSLQKTLMLEKIEGRRRKEQQRKDSWMISPTRWTWVSVSAGRWWKTQKPGMLMSMGSQRVGHVWATEQQYICQFQYPSSPHLSFPLDIHSFILTSVSLFQLYKLVHIYCFSRFNIQAILYDICFSLSDLLHSGWQSTYGTLGLSMSLQIARFCSFLWLSKQSQFSHAIMSDSLQPHGLQHTRIPCLSSTPKACSNSCPLSQWCHPTISSSIIPFSSCLQSFPASRFF